MSSVPTAQTEIPTIVIRPSSGWIGLKLHELWEGTSDIMRLIVARELLKD